jgi:hypothetical protein
MTPHQFTYPKVTATVVAATPYAPGSQRPAPRPSPAS